MTPVQSSCLFPVQSSDAEITERSFQIVIMASLVNICSVNVLDNPSKFTDPFKLEITFEVFENLAEGFSSAILYCISWD